MSNIEVPATEWEAESSLPQKALWVATAQIEAAPFRRERYKLAWHLRAAQQPWVLRSGSPGSLA